MLNRARAISADQRTDPWKGSKRIRLPRHFPGLPIASIQALPIVASSAEAAKREYHRDANGLKVLGIEYLNAADDLPARCPRISSTDQSAAAYASALAG
jgi:hypothetical protein